MRKVILILLIITSSSLLAQRKFVVYCPEDALEQSEKVLMSQVGLKEKTGRNDGTHVELYLKSVGLKGRYAYCAAGQYYCFSQASYNPLPKTGSVATLWNFAKKQKQTPLIPQRHDLIMWLSNKGTGHVERIIEVLSMGWLKTVGFNTTNSTGNQRDGGGVYIRLRNLYHPLSRILKNKGLLGFYEK